MRNMTIPAVIFALSLIAAYFIFDIGQYLSLEFLQAKHQLLSEHANENRIATIAIYFLVYVISAVLSLPGISLLTIGAGAIFGFTTGLILVSFASAIGATLAFLLARYLFKDVVQNKFSSQLQKINNGIETEGAFYLFTMRLIPLIPYFLINLLMGLTPIKTSLFYLVSQVGMLPVTAIFTYSGNQLAQIKTLEDILSPSLLFAFALLGIFPIVTKKLIDFYKRKKSSVQK